MNFAAIAVKTVGAGAAAALLSLGMVGALAQAASSPSPSPSASTSQASTDTRSDRRAVLRAVFASEAAVLHISPGQLLTDLRHGLTVEQLARVEGMDKAQFTDRLIRNLRPRLEELVEHHVITRAQAERVIDWIQKGHVPFWNGLPDPETVPSS